MAEIIRVSRENNSVFVAKQGNKYFVVDQESNTTTQISSLSEASKTSWRMPLASERTALTASAGQILPKGEKTFRVPAAVQSTIKSALESNSFSSPVDIDMATALASGNPVSGETVQWVKHFYAQAGLRGGEAGKTWSEKFSDVALTAAAPTEVLTDTYEYFALGPNEEEPDQANGLLAISDEDETLFIWKNSKLIPIPVTRDSFESPSIVEIDHEDALELANWLDDPENSDKLFNLTDIDPEERNLVNLAYSEIDWDEIDRIGTLVADATGYSPVERSQNASRQVRSNDGRFGGEQIEQGTELSPSMKKATLPGELPLVLDPAARIQSYIDHLEFKEIVDESLTAAVGDSDAVPLYFAIVDPVDTTAVLDVVSIVSETPGTSTTWKRSEGDWVPAPEMLDDLLGDTPPAVVELDTPELAKNVLAQVDQFDAGTKDIVDEQTITASADELADYSKKQRENDSKKGLALPDGSYPIRNVKDLQNAIKAYGRAPESKRADVRKHIKKRANALNRKDLIPDNWKEASLIEEETSALFGEFGELISITAAGIPGIADTASDKAAVERLKRYWAFGKGTAKWRPGTPGDLTRLSRALAKYVGPKRSWGLAQTIFKMRFGMTNAEYDKKMGT